MTQSVVNNWNNIEQMLSTSKAANKLVENSFSGMDKAENFKDVLKTKLDKTYSTIGSIKNRSLDENKTLADFRKVLEEETNEIGVESSLDLTLVKDVEDSDSESKNDADSSPDVLCEQVFLCFGELKKSENTDCEQGLEEASSAVLDTIESASSEIVDIAEDVVTAKTSEETQIDDLEALLDEDMVKELNIESIKAETDTSGNDSMMQNQTPEENALKAMINQHGSETFDVKVDTTQQVQKPQVESVEVNSGRIIEQVSKHLESLQNTSRVSIVLNPESLGKVDIQLVNTKEGLAAQFTVSTQEARDLLMKGLDGLKDTLAAHGVGVDNVSVKVSNSQKSEYNPDWTEQEGSNGGNKGQEQPNREEKEKGLFEKMMAESTENKNGNV